MFTTVSESTIRSKGANYKRRDSSWISGKKFLTVRAVQLWNRWLREVVILRV